MRLKLDYFPRRIILSALTINAYPCKRQLTVMEMSRMCRDKCKVMPEPSH